MIEYSNILRLIRIVYRQVPECARIDKPEIAFEHEVDVLGIPLIIRGRILQRESCRTTVEKHTSSSSWAVTDTQLLYMAWIWRTGRLRDIAFLRRPKCELFSITGTKHLQHDLAILLLLEE